MTRCLRIGSGRLSVACAPLVAVLLALVTSAGVRATHRYDIATLTLGGSSSSVFAANGAGQLVGQSALSGDTEYHTFSWTSGGGIVDLGTLGGTWSAPSFVTESGQVVGRSAAAGDAASHAFSWTSLGGLMDLGTLGGSNSNPIAVNAAGEVIGTSSHPGDLDNGGFSWTAVGGMVEITGLGGHGFLPVGLNEAGQVIGRYTSAAGAQRAFSWTVAGGAVDLGLGGFDTSTAAFVTNAGAVIGSAFAPATNQRHAFIWTSADGASDLGTLGGSLVEVTAMNSSGQVVGRAATAGTGVADGPDHAFSWTSATGIVDLGTLGGALTASAARFVTDAGQVIGIATDPSQTVTHSFSWTAADGMVDLGTLGGQWIEPFHVTPGGDVIGQSTTIEELEHHAFVWTVGGGMVDVGTFGGTESWTVRASGGVLAGGSYAPGDAEWRAFRWSASGGMVDLGGLGGNYSEAQLILPSGQLAGTASTIDDAWFGVVWTPVTPGGDDIVPQLHTPGPVIAEATGPDGAVVGFLVTATDPGDAIGDVSCAPASGTLFPLGSTIVHCAAADSHGNVGRANFSVTVADTTPPVMTMPTRIVTPFAFGARFFSPALDLVNGFRIPSCSPAFGSTLPIGTSNVTCTVSDLSSNTASTSFSVEVVLIPTLDVSTFVIPTLGGAAENYANAVNSSGQVVGGSRTSGNESAFLWTEAGGLIDLGPGVAIAINDAGQVLIASGAASLWTAATGRVELGSFSPVAMNSAGHVIGVDGSRGVLWTPAGGLVDLGDFQPTAINDTDEIAGSVQGPLEAAIWTPSGGLRRLGNLGSDSDGTSQAFDINNAGLVVGQSTASTPDLMRPFAWTAGGGMVDLGSLGAEALPGDQRYNGAHRVNNVGQVLGESNDHLFRWTAGGGLEDLGLWTAAGLFRQVRELGEDGHAVGVYRASVALPFSWTPARGLGLLPGLGGDQTLANGVNNSGWIVGEGGTAPAPPDGSSFIRAILWRPPNTPTGSTVTALLVDPAGGSSPGTVQFSGVTSPGETSVDVSPAGPPLPAGFALGSPETFFEISTTAGVTPPMTVCLGYSNITFANSSAIRMLHYENGTWADVTTSVDTAGERVCGVVSSLSPFTLAVPASTPPAVQVITPNGGNRLFAGFGYVITWNAAAGSSPLASFSVQYSTNNGGTFVTVPGCGLVGASARQCPWVPLVLSGAARVRVVARDSVGRTAADVSDASFTIVIGLPVIHVSSPDEETSLVVGTVAPIRWQHDLGTASSPATFVVEISRNGLLGPWQTIAASVPQATATTGRLDWLVTAPTSANVRVRVRAIHQVVQDTSPRVSIANPSLTLSAPAGGTTWNIGTTATFRWTTNLGAAETVRIEISRNGGATWSLLNGSVAASAGRFTWAVIGPATTQFRARITWNGNPAVKSASTANSRIR